MLGKPVPLSATNSEFILLTPPPEAMPTRAGTSWFRQINTQYITHYWTLIAVGLLVCVMGMATTRSHMTLISTLFHLGSVL